MPDIHQIVTHPGGAHKDDFLACCVMLHLHQVPVFRREPAGEDLEDPGTVVIDIGHRHEPEKNNFDHHQFPRDHPPTCALSLVLQHLGIYEDALKFCDWLEPAEWLDARGPREAAEWLEVDRAVINQLVSPIDVTMLRGFASGSEWREDSTIWQLMEMVGGDLVNYLRDLRDRLDFIDQHAEFWTISSERGEFDVLFMPITEPLPEEPSGGLGRFIEEKGKEDSVLAMVYPDRRGDGYGLKRFNDDVRMDFSSLESDCPDVHFSHARGFIAKTSATEKDRLKELLDQSFRP